MTPTHARGACLCGAVRFRAELPSKWVAHCHCTMCQRAHGAGVVTWAGFPAERVAIEPGAAEPTWYASSAEGQRAFCARCGSPMFFRSARWPGELHVARALFTEPLDREPGLHVFHDSHVDWLRIDDDLPKRPKPAAPP